MCRTALVLVLTIVLLGSMLTYPAQGEKYPTQPIEILIPFQAGGSYDLYARLLVEKAQRYLEQPMVVLNKPGGSGSTIAAELINSKPDGYRIAVLDTNYFTTIVKTQKVPFDPSHLIPIMACVEQRPALGVRNDSPWKNLNEMLTYGKNNPKKIKWGHTGRGMGPAMGTRMVFSNAGIDTIDIPHKGAPASIAAVLGGHLDAVAATIGNLANHVKAGTMRVLVVYGDKRHKDLPDVPCAQELGFSEAAALKVWIGLFIHKDTSKETIKTLFDVFKKACENPEFVEGINKIGGDEPGFWGQELVIKLIKEQEKRSVPILKELGIYVGN